MLTTYPNASFTAISFLQFYKLYLVISPTGGFAFMSFLYDSSSSAPSYGPPLNIKFPNRHASSRKNQGDFRP